MNLQLFERYIGIDYSGAKTPISRLNGLQVFMAITASEPEKIQANTETNWNWTRKEIAHWCVRQLLKDEPVIIGIDHAFSFPHAYLERYKIQNWDHFLKDLCQHWPTDKDKIDVESLRHNNKRTGKSDELRLTEKWTTAAQSVFKLDGQGSVGKSTHTGIPWLNFIRQEPRLKGRAHFWPFDGFETPKGKSVIAEVYPSLFRRRFPRIYKSPDEHDAFSIALWLKQMDSRGVLKQYFDPPLSETERQQGLLEGWILGVY
ncbi:MAG TPA: hypothetical protein HPQ03_09980 [Deltaproteobacteria bacterium]|nr:hypothetical protein [Deltaproteobacteria bacterium]